MADVAVARAKERYLLEPEFHAVCKLAEHIITVAWAEKHYTLTDGERDVASMAAAVALELLDSGRIFPERITIQLEPERVSRLIQVLRSAGAHPSGLGSYEAANDANALADDIANMVAPQRKHLGI